MAVVAIAVGLGVAGAGIAGSVLSANSSSDAIKAQQNALNQLGQISIPSLQTQAANADIAKYQAQFQQEAAIDPNFAALRNQGAAGYLTQLQADASNNTPADAAISGMEGNLAGSQSVISGLVSQANQELSEGATLPPEFQAELVRSGLESSGQGGLSIDGRGAAGTNIRTLLGSAGLALQQQRQGFAQNVAGAANAQTNALAELAQMSNALTQSKANRAATGAAIGSAAVPSIGLSGADVSNLALANLNAQNQKVLAQGNLQAQGDLAKGQMWQGILGSLSQGATAGFGLGQGGVGGGSSSGSSVPNISYSLPTVGQINGLNSGAGPVSSGYISPISSYLQGLGTF